MRTRPLLAWGGAMDRAGKHFGARVPGVLAAVLLLAGCAGSAPVTERMALAADPAASPAPVVATPPTAKVSDDQRVRCEDQIVTGSRVPQRVCRTEFQWRQLEEQSKERGRELQGPIYGSDVPGSPPI